MYKTPNLSRRARAFCRRHGYDAKTDKALYKMVLQALESGYTSAMRDFYKLILPDE